MIKIGSIDKYSLIGLASELGTTWNLPVYHDTVCICRVMIKLYEISNF